MIKSNYTATPMAHPPPGSSSGFTGAWPIPSEMPYSDHRDTSCYGLQNFVTTLKDSDLNFIHEIYLDKVSFFLERQLGTGTYGF